MKRVLIVEDEAILRELMCRLVDSHTFLEVAGSTGDGAEALPLCEKLRPDLVILDMMLPGLHGLDILKRLKVEQPGTAILVFSALNSLGMVKKVVQLGVDGFVEKGSCLEELEKAFDKLAAGETHFSARIVEKMRDLMLNAGQSDALDELTAREREIVKLVAESHTSKEIASKLCISPKTAETHRTNIMRKLQLHDVAGLTRFAVSHGLVEVKAQV